MTGWQDVPYREVDIWPPETEMEKRVDGVVLVRSPRPLGSFPRRMTDRLVHWAEVAPDRTFVAERSGSGADGEWRRLTYAEALDKARRVATALIERGLGPERPLLVLSDNGIDHQLLALGALYAGIPYAPISPAYSLVSRDFGKLKHIVAKMTPGMVFAADGSRFAAAIAAAVPFDVEVVIARGSLSDRSATSLADVLSTTPSSSADAANARVGAETIAKVLFTSGSTGLPKGVINTHGMWCSNIEINTATIFECCRDEPPVIVDWLPWNHTFGGNANVGLVLTWGGTLYVDGGRPAPGLIDMTVRNLREISPTHYFNVPKGFELLVHHMQHDAELRRSFFRRLKLYFFAGAGLAQHIWDALDRLAVEETGERIVMMTGLGATETGPTALMTTSDGARSGSIGLPCPGVELKLVPREGKLEIRVKSPSITPGYWREPELSEKAFDEEGYYCFNDAVKFADPTKPERGFVFDGRITEDFKLATGTWVSVGPLRTKFIAAFAPYARDVVIAGLNRDFLAGIMIPDVDACRLAARLSPGASLADVMASPALRVELSRRLQDFDASSTGSSTRIERLVVLDEAPSIDAGEITDKGSINQRAVLEYRSGLVDALYSEVPPDSVMALDRTLR